MMTWYIDGSIAMGNLDVFATDKTLGDYRVCMVDCDDETVSEQDLAANAKLIAAAPDMLELLVEAQEALDVLADDAEDAGYHARAEGAAELAMRLRAAIAKAKGA